MYAAYKKATPTFFSNV